VLSKIPRALFFLLLALAAALPAMTWAAYPDRPIKLVVAFPPGGGSDLIARLIGKSLSQAVGQPVIVENMPGAWGSVAVNHVAKAPADGYTLMLGTTGTLPIPVAMQVKMPYDPLKDLSPVTQVAITPIVLVVNPSLPARTYKEFAELVKRSPPGSLFYGTWGAGSVGHFVGELLKSRANLAMTHVPYKGSGPLVTDLLAGQVKIGFLEASTAAPLVSSGKLRALAVASLQRAPGLPDVPTLSEVGVPYAQSAWYGIVGPKNMPADVMQRLNSELCKVLGSEEMRARFASMGMTAAPTTSAEFGKIMDGDVKVWSAVARTAQIKVD
jgi:tripartite-type tricarboxylate transporter receptor subunit TctC